MTNSRGKIGILNYGAGNFGSVKRALEALHVAPIEVCDERGLNQVDRLVFPGVGSAQQAMTELTQRGLVEPLIHFAKTGKPLLGICVGMQVLGEWSAEGETQCLGLLPYRIEKFMCAEPIPHMGWNSVSWQGHHPIVREASESISLAANFYFVHSYAAFLNSSQQIPDFVLGTTQYGDQDFCAFVAQENVWGAQCHIEKSGRIGLQVIDNFLRWERA